MRMQNDFDAVKAFSFFLDRKRRKFCVGSPFDFFKTTQRRPFLAIFVGVLFSGNFQKMQKKSKKCLKIAKTARKISVSSRFCPKNEKAPDESSVIRKPLKNASHCINRGQNRRHIDHFGTFFEVHTPARGTYW